MTDAQAGVIAATSVGVVVALKWRQSGSPPSRVLFQVLRLKEGRVVDIEDHRDRRKALSAVAAPA